MTSNWPKVNPGEFRHQITLLEELVGSGPSGASVAYVADDPPIQAWAKIEYLRGDEIIKSGQDISQAFLMVTMWYRPQFVVGKRIQVPSGNQYIIQNVDNTLEMNTYMTLHCIGIGANE